MAGEVWTHFRPQRPRSFRSAWKHDLKEAIVEAILFPGMFCCSCGENCPLEAKYCHQCGDPLKQNVTEREASVDELIKGYSHRGYPYQAIVSLLEKQDSVRMHVRTLKRKLRDLVLKRKAANHDEDIGQELITIEVQGAGSLAGYRYIWHALRLRHHVNVPRSQVASIMKEIDPKRSRRLRRRAYVSYGPNLCWHIDGRCKLGDKSHYPSLRLRNLGDLEACYKIVCI